MLCPNEQSIGVSLAELFPEATRTGAGRVMATSCCTDWRQLEPGDVYVALPDSGDGTTDGHEHARRAASHGAIAIVCEQPVPVFDVPTYLVPDSRVALGELSQALVGNPSNTISVIAVTGSHGKSTTIALLESIFSAAGKHCGTMSSLGCYDGMSHSAGISNSPSAPAIAERLARMEAAGCTHALLEVSSRAISQARLAGINLDSVSVTNVTSAHLDLHNSLVTYREVQRRVLDYLSPGGVVTLNADDPECVKWLDEVQGPVLTWGLGDQAEITAQVVQQFANEQVFVLSAGDESAAVRSSMVGDHHVSNCLAAATVAMTYGIDLQTIAAGIEAVDRLSGRMERIDCGQGFPVYVDAADTPDALRASLRTARQLAQGRVICVLGPMAGHSASVDYTLRHIVSRMTDLAIASRPLGNGDDEQLDSAPIEIIADRGEAIAYAVAIAEPGDVVVIAGSQPRPIPIFGESGDAQLARQLLYSRNESAIRLAA